MEIEAAQSADPTPAPTVSRTRRVTQSFRDLHSVYALRATATAFFLALSLTAFPELIGLYLFDVTNAKETVPQILFCKYLPLPILACSLLFGIVSSRAVSRAFAALNALMLLIAGVRLILLREYNIAFSPAFFANLDLHTATLAVRMFPLESALLVLAVLAVYWGCRRAFKPSPILSSTIFCWCICITAFACSARGLLSWPRQLFQVPLISLVNEGRKYYSQSTLTAMVPWTVPEIAEIAALGFDYRRGAPIAIPPESAKNIVIVYLEGLNTELTGVGGSKVPGITPNLDRFARENTFVPNFFASAAPSLPAFVSTQCGLLADYASEQFDRNAGLPPKAVCLPEVLGTSKYQRMFLLGAELQFSGFDHLVHYLQYDQALGRDELLNRYPEYAQSGHRLGLYDSQVFDIAFREIERFDKSRPFLLSIFTFDTHPPYYNSPDCIAEITGTPFEESLNCQDQAVGAFLKKLEESEYGENTIVILLGDHLHHASPVRTKIGRTYFAFSHPGIELPAAIDAAAHSPDVVPTIFELLGDTRHSYYAGKSIASDRQQFQHLVSPVFEYVNGEYRTQPNDCSSDQLLATTLVQGDAPTLNACQLQKLFLFQRKALS